MSLGERKVPAGQCSSCGLQGRVCFLGFSSFWGRPPSLARGPSSDSKPEVLCCCLRSHHPTSSRSDSPPPLSLTRSL